MKSEFSVHEHCVCGMLNLTNSHIDGQVLRQRGVVCVGSAAVFITQDDDDAVMVSSRTSRLLVNSLVRFMEIF